MRDRDYGLAVPASRDLQLEHLLEGEDDLAGQLHVERRHGGHVASGRRREVVEVQAHVGPR
eukprot:7045919-Pyramimonas_sp.AAC.1